MHNELKRAIVNYIFDNQNVFGLHNATTKQFSHYIYDTQGEYLIGGERVSEFISQAIKLITEGK